MKKNKDLGYTNSTIDEIENKIKMLYGNVNVKIDEMPNTPLCLDYYLNGANDFFIQLSSPAWLEEYYINRTRSPKNAIPRPGVTSCDGTHSTLKTKNQIQVNIHSMDVNHE